MKDSIHSIFGKIRISFGSILGAFLLLVPVALRAQVSTPGTTTPRVISYQGTITATDESSVSGNHLITTTLYSDAGGHSIVWSGKYQLQINGSVFSALLGSGGYPFPTTLDFSKSFWIGVKIDNGEELKPLTQLTGTPYSLSIADSSVTKDKMAVNYISSISLNGKQITGKGTSLNLTNGPGTTMSYDEATNSLSFSMEDINGPTGEKGTHPQGGGGPPCTQPYWQTNGNSAPGVSCGSTFGFTSPTSGCPDILMMNNNTIQMTMLGATTPGNGLMFPVSSTNGVGVIFQDQGGTAGPTRYIHSYGGSSNFFAGQQAGNLMFSYVATCTGVATNTENTGVGYQALMNLNGTGCDIVSGDSTTPPDTLAQGSRNTALGYQALATNSLGWENTATGFWALWLNVHGNKNTAVGACALEHLGDPSHTPNTPSSLNTAVGWGAMSDAYIGSYNTAVGCDALSNNNGASNVAVGIQALLKNNTGNWNSALGANALLANTSGFYNTALGYNALVANTDGNDNSACGAWALSQNTSGGGNTATGYSALPGNTTGDFNTATGTATLSSNTSGNYNTATGANALQSNTTGSNNTAQGFKSLFHNTGVANTSIGSFSLINTDIGWGNAAVGYTAGSSNTSGSYNTFVGYAANSSSSSLTNATAIGDLAVVSASNTIELGNSSVTAVSTYGHVVTQSVIGSQSDDGTIVTSVSAAGSDVAGTVTIGTAASSGSGSATINFGTTYSSAPIVVITPASLSAQYSTTGIAGYYVTEAAGGGSFTINVNNGSAGVSGAVFNYMVIH